MARFTHSNQAAFEATIDTRRAGTVKGAILPIGRGDVATLFTSPGR